MSLIRKSAAAICTGCLAIFAGYAVPFGPEDGPPSVRKASQAPSSAVSTVMMRQDGSGGSVFGLPGIVKGPGYIPAGTLAISAVLATELVELEPPKTDFVPASPVDGCETDLRATQRPGAMVMLQVLAPCLKETEFVIWHSHMAFSGRTDEKGFAAITAPALLDGAPFIMTVRNVEEGRVLIDVPELRQFDRVVLQWRGSENLNLHALEFGAGVGSAGHVWSASTKLPESRSLGARGFVVRLGVQDAKTPYWAEVYTYPSGLRGDIAEVALKIGALVTESNCGREIDATGLRTRMGRAITTRPVTVAMPDCATPQRSVMQAGHFGTAFVVSQ